MNNIFENAYFGKPYKTRNGRRAIYDKERIFVKGWHWVLIEDEGMYQLNDNGLLQENEETRFDIVSEWQEVSEEELDKLAEDFLSEGYENNCNPDFMECCKNIYKAGYRKAKQE